MNYRSRTREPDIRTTNRKTTISHCEYFSDLTVSNSAVVPNPDQTTYFRQLITPNNPAIFPWLAQIIFNYETYKFKKLIFEYVPYTATSTQGVVILAVDYDPGDEAPSQKSDFMSMEESVRTPVWSSIKHVCSAANLLRHGVNKYTDLRYSTAPETIAFQRQNVVGMLNVVAMNGTVQSSVGELYVHYEIELQTPQLSNSATYKSFRSVNLNSTVPFNFSPSSIAVGNAFDSNLPISFPTTSRISLDFPTDYVLLMVEALVDHTIAPLTGYPGITTGGNVTLVKALLTGVQADGSGAINVGVYKYSQGGDFTIGVPAGMTALNALKYGFVAMPISIGTFDFWSGLSF